MRQHWPWLAWAASTLAGFTALETMAFRTGRLPTLTAVLRHALGIDPRHDQRTIRAATAIGGLTGGLVALGVHLAHTGDDELAVSLRRGIEQARRGETVDLGSFARYAEN